MDSLRILALDASVGSGSVCALAGDEIVAERLLDPASKTARTLAPAMAAVLREAGWRPKEVGLVAVGIGPGSFTGLRIAVTAAKTVAFAVGSPIVGINTLRAIAAQSQFIGEIQAVLDAQRGELFVERFHRAAGEELCQVTSLGEPEIAPAKDWLARWAEPTVAILLTGAGLARHEAAVRGLTSISVAPVDFWNPNAATIGRLAALDYAAGKRDDVLTVAPVYMRVSYAEEKK